jgi:hypothetical protein
VGVGGSVVNVIVIVVVEFSAAGEGGDRGGCWGKLLFCTSKKEVNKSKKNKILNSLKFDQIKKYLKKFFKIH